MHFMKLCVITTICVTSWVASAQSDYIGEAVIAPGGLTSYHVQGKPDEAGDVPIEIIQCLNHCEQKKVVLTSKHAEKPEDNLYEFSNLKLSVDSGTLFFESDAWATSNAIHALDIKSGKQRYVTAGSLACVVGSGQFQGDLIVQQHRYFIQGGSYNPLYMYDPQGKELGIVALDGDDAPKFCAQSPLG